MMKRILFDSAPAEGNGMPAEKPAAVPPAAAAVISGTKTEAELTLEKDLKDERDRHATTAAEKKQREIRISELEDELRRLRETQSGPVRPSKKGMMEKFLSGESEAED